MIGLDVVVKLELYYDLSKSSVIPLLSSCFETDRNHVVENHFVEMGTLNV